VYLLLLRNFYFVNHLNNTKSQQILNLHFLIIVVRLLLPWFCNAWRYQYIFENLCWQLETDVIPNFNF
jgi:hypothetical protein